MAKNPWVEGSRLLDRKRMMEDKRYMVCCHEASHAVTALAMGQRFRQVRIHDGEESKVLGAGSTEHGSNQISGYEAPWRMAATMAGVVFDRLRFPRKSLVVVICLGGCYDDYRQTENLAKAVYKKWRKPLKDCMGFTREFLLKHWDMVLAVAEKLYQVGTLTERDVMEISSKDDDPRLNMYSWEAWREKRWPDDAGETPPAQATEQ